jgi:prefoldin subunit 5
MILGVALLAFPTNVWSESVEDVINTLEATIQELQDAQDTLEQYRSDVDDLDEALNALHEAKRTMRTEAISLLLASVEVRKKGDFDRVMTAIRDLGYNLERQPKAK